MAWTLMTYDKTNRIATMMDDQSHIFKAKIPDAQLVDKPTFLAYLSTICAAQTIAIAPPSFDVTPVIGTVVG